MSIPNIGVGSPITIANINEIINGINKIANDLQLLKVQVDKAVSSAASSGGNSALYVTEKPYSTRSFEITAAQSSLPTNAVFTAVDIIGIIQNGTNLLSKGFTAKVDKVAGIGTRKLDINIKVTKSTSAPDNPAPSETVRWKFDIDYEISTN